MFNKDFYPTPESVINQMLYAYYLYDSVVLEPSAGKGDIVDYLHNNGAKEVIACEINDDLAKIVSQKCKLIARDFLDVKSEHISHVNLIIMNPPFSNDENHILHAYDIAPEGCNIISLCNSATIENICSSNRKKLQEKIQLYGRSENFGSCFDNAERKTGVNVSCVWLKKPKLEEDKEFEGYFSLNEEVEQQGEGLVKFNYVRDTVSRYMEAIKLFDQFEPIAKRMNEMTSVISPYFVKCGAFLQGDNYYSAVVSRDEFKKILQKQCWNKVFADMKMDKYITKGVKKDINKFVEQQQNIPFTMENIYKMLDVIVGTHAETMNKVIIEAFENICDYSWRENCTGGDNWKTNANYMVNRRFIVPYICESNFYGTKYENVKLKYTSSEKLEDIVKALCFITGTDYSQCELLEGFVKRNEMKWEKLYDWGFFRIRGYKKGTMHFEFKDEDVWAKFNIRASEIKGWSLPEKSSSKCKK